MRPLLSYIFLQIYFIAITPFQVVAQSSIYLCDGLYKTSPCNSRENGGRVENLPPLIKYNWFKFANAKNPKTAQGSLKNTVEKAIEPKINSQSTARSRLSSNGEIVSDPKKSVAIKNTTATKEAIVKKTSVDRSFGNQTAVRLLQRILEFRFAAPGRIARGASRSVRSELEQYWNQLELLCRKDVQKFSDTKVVCERAWKDLIEVEKSF